MKISYIIIAVLLLAVMAVPVHAALPTNIGSYSVITTTTSVTTFLPAKQVLILLDIYAVTTSTYTVGNIVLSDATGANSITLSVLPNKSKTRSVMPSITPLKFGNGFNIQPKGTGVSAIPVYLK